MAKSATNNKLVFKAIMRIIFPEIQLLGHYKEVGFINKEFFRVAKKAVTSGNKSKTRSKSNSVATKFKDQ